MTAAPDTTRSDRDTQNPWERFGWIMGAIWLVFLIFPLSAAITTDTSRAGHVFAVAAVLAFAATYLHGFVRVGRAETWARVHRSGWSTLAALVALTAAAAMVIGVSALGMLSFIVAFATFTLPTAGGLAVALVGVGVALLVPMSLGILEDSWFLALIVLGVGVSTGVIRVLERRGAEHQQLSAEMSLIAERERVARDVHDVLGHSLTVVTVKAELAQRLVDADPARAKSELAQIQSLTREALAEIRATVAGLRVARLGDELQSAAAALADAGITAEVPTDASVVDPRHRIVLAWVLREAATNVVRHSDARRCTVEIGSSMLSVVDDGRGLGDHPEGNGLRGVRERVAAAGGSLSVASGGDGRGTTVRVDL